MRDHYVLVEIDLSTGMTIEVVRTFESDERAQEDLDLLTTLNPERVFKIVTVVHVQG